MTVKPPPRRAEPEAREVAGIDLRVSIVKNTMVGQSTSRRLSVSTGWAWLASAVVLIIVRNVHAVRELGVCHHQTER
jgi:hypothetical protein